MTAPHRAPALAGLAGIRHAFFTRAGGVSAGIYASLNAGLGSRDAPENVVQNRARMAAALGVAPQALFTCQQVHSADAIAIAAPFGADARPRADGMATATPGLALAVSTADCSPVLFADPVARVVGAAHAGWRGALAGVTDATIAAMQSLGAARPRILAAIGPMIRQDSYEVGLDLKGRFIAADAANARFFRDGAREAHFLFDLAGYVAARLAAAGLARIEDIGACTYADVEHFFSYRRMTHRNEPDYGRHLSAIVLAQA